VLLNNLTLFPFGLTVNQVSNTYKPKGGLTTMFSTLAIESVTPAQAAEWLSFNTMNRPVRQAHVDFLA